MSGGLALPASGIDTTTMQLPNDGSWDIPTGKCLFVENPEAPFSAVEGYGNLVRY